MFGNLTWPDGSGNIGGTGTTHYYALQADILTLTAPAPGGTPALGDLVTVTEDIVMKSGKKFYSVYSTLDTGQVEDKMVGSFDCKSYESSFSFNFPGTQAAALELIANFANSTMVFIATEADGTHRIIGGQIIGAKLEDGSTTTGKKTSDYKGTMLKVTSRGTKPAYIYTGEVAGLLVAAP